MSYEVRRYADSVIIDGGDLPPRHPIIVRDDSIDNTSTSIQFVGNEFTDYSKFIFENYTWILENFGGILPPPNPVKGQIWFRTFPDSKDTGYYVYNYPSKEDIENGIKPDAPILDREDFDSIDEYLDRCWLDLTTTLFNALKRHIVDYDNPHVVSKEQIGLGNIAANIGGVYNIDLNLADVIDNVMARNNLSVYSKAQTLSKAEADTRYVKKGKPASDTALLNGDPATLFMKSSLPIATNTIDMNSITDNYVFSSNNGESGFYIDHNRDIGMLSGLDPTLTIVGSGSGAVISYKISTRPASPNWSSDCRQVKTTPVNTANDSFGESTTLSKNGIYAAASSKITGTLKNNQGAVHMYALSADDKWNFIETLVSPSPTINGDFGYSINISPNGGYLIVGAIGEPITHDATEHLDAGAAYVYSRNTSGHWSLYSKIESPNPETYKRFGHTVKISGNNATLAISSDSESNSSKNGSVHIYRLSNSVWMYEATITGTSKTFGHSLSFTKDGNALAIGAPEADSAKGSLHVYKKFDGEWVIDTKLSPTDLIVGDYFGWSCSISDDGREIAVGAPNKMLTNTFGGVVYVFEKIVGTWGQVAQIKSSNSKPNDKFGYTCELSGNMSTLMVGAIYDDTIAYRSGAIYLFSYDKTRTTPWYEIKKVVPNVNSNPYNAQFGRTLTPSFDSQQLLTSSYTTSTLVGNLQFCYICSFMSKISNNIGTPTHSSFPVYMGEYLSLPASNPPEWHLDLYNTKNEKIKNYKFDRNGLYIDGNKVYHQNHKPTTDEVGALSRNNPSVNSDKLNGEPSSVVSIPETIVARSNTGTILANNMAIKSKTISALSDFAHIAFQTTGNDGDIKYTSISDLRKWLTVDGIQPQIGTYALASASFDPVLTSTNASINAENCVILKLGIGIYRVTFTTAMPSNEYCVMLSESDNSLIHGWRNNIVDGSLEYSQVWYSNKTAGSFDIYSSVIRSRWRAADGGTTGDTIGNIFYEAYSDANYISFLTYDY